MQNFKFKHETLKPWVLRKRLRMFAKLANHEQTQSGFTWYEQMHHWCAGAADRSDVELFKYVGVFAAMSPQMSVDRNKELANQYFREGRAAHYNMLNDKADRIMGAESPEQVADILGGNKITSFFWNILQPTKATRVTIDRHALASMLQTPSTVTALADRVYDMTDQQYARFERIYADVASELQMLPHQLQAVVWNVYRDLRDLREYQHEPATDCPF